MFIKKAIITLQWAEGDPNQSKKDHMLWSETLNAVKLPGVPKLIDNKKQQKTSIKMGKWTKGKQLDIKNMRKI